MENKFQNLPPETQEKIKAAFSKLNGNPNLGSFASVLSAVVKNAQELKSTYPVLIQQNPSTSTPTQPEQTSSLSSKDYAALNKKRNLSPTYNPHLPDDNLRRNIFIIAVSLLIGYLVIKFGFNGKSPF